MQRPIGRQCNAAPESTVNLSRSILLMTSSLFFQIHCGIQDCSPGQQLALGPEGHGRWGPKFEAGDDQQSEGLTGEA